MQGSSNSISTESSGRGNSRTTTERIFSWRRMQGSSNSISTESSGRENSRTTTESGIRWLEKWQLRIIVHEVVDIVVREIFPSPYITFNDVTDKKKFLSLVYKKGKVLGSTDVHKRCVNKRGLFNYRFVKDGEGQLPVIQLTLMEEDRHTRDDFLGSLIFDFTAIPEPGRTAENITKSYFKMEHQYINLLEHNSDADFPRTISGYWPMKGRKLNCSERFVSGKIHLTIQLLTEEEAENNPVLSGTPDDDDENNAKPKLSVPMREHGHYTDKFIGDLENYFRKISQHAIVKYLGVCLFITINVLILVLWMSLSLKPTAVILLDYSLIMTFIVIMFIVIYFGISFHVKNLFRRRNQNQNKPSSNPNGQGQEQINTEGPPTEARPENQTLLEVSRLDGASNIPRVSSPEGPSNSPLIQGQGHTPERPQTAATSNDRTPSGIISPANNIGSGSLQRPLLPSAPNGFPSTGRTPNVASLQEQQNPSTPGVSPPVTGVKNKHWFSRFSFRH